MVILSSRFNTLLMDSSFFSYLGIPALTLLRRSLLSSSFVPPLPLCPSPPVVVGGGVGVGVLGVGEGVDEGVGVGVEADNASLTNSGGGGGRTNCLWLPEKDLLWWTGFTEEGVRFIVSWLELVG